MTRTATDLDQLCINTIRTLAMDAVQQANSGHPGAPIALSPLAYLLYTKFLRHDPADAAFPNRDRLVLSAGHASMLLYASLHLSGYGISLDDIKAFRQLESATPGHPEYGCAPGVETTTGPLGQGAANSVGMAVAEKWLAAHFNRDDQKIVDYRVFAILGDGCMMEGISAEAASLAGHLALNNLIWFYDSNRITIEGRTDLALSEDVDKRFEAYGWFVQHVTDAEDLAAISQATETAINENKRPSLIVLDSIIARGAPTKQNTAKAHGEPLGEDEIRKTKQFYDWDPDAKFFVPPEVSQHWTESGRRRGAELRAQWNERFERYASAHPDLAKQWRQLQSRELPDGWDRDLPKFDADAKGLATRASAGKVLNALADTVPWLIGGSADLAPSTKTLIASSDDFTATNRISRNMRFGVREHAMTAMCNGMALSGLRPYAASFLVFTDYARPAIRLAALMHQPVILVFTHDSIGVGEDGPTHQPVEHLASLRAIPNLDVFRPADANEAVVAWKHAITTTDRPVLLALSRQAVPTLDRTQCAPAENALRGGYTLIEGSDKPDVILIGTGTELHLCVAAHKRLADDGITARVVSLPCWELFERQDEAYCNQVLPPQITARVAVEAGTSFGWERYAGPDGAIIAQTTFGASAPCADAMRHFGFTVENVVAKAKDRLSQSRN